MNRTLIRFTLAMMAAMVCLSFGSLKAASVDSATASLFVGNWLQANNNPVLADGVARTLEAPVAITAPESEEVLGYVFNLKPYGFVVVAADTLINPVVMHSAGGQYDADPRNPLVGMLVSDLAARKAAVESELRAPGQDEYYAANQDAWAKYTSETRGKAAYILQEIWVDKLVQTEWSQADAGDLGPVYNYYTPNVSETGAVSWDKPGDPRNAVTGCVATATGQLVNFYRWPQKAVGNKSNQVTVGGTVNIVGNSQVYNRRMRGGDGQGGAYDWDLMVNCPGVATNDPRYQEISDANIQAIGALLYDAGVSVGMGYYHTNSGESGANLSTGALINYFQFAGAASLSADRYNQMRASLDAHRPFYLSFFSPMPTLEPGASSGHAILADGYGRMDGRWFFHLNLGWGSFYPGANAWYNFDDYTTPNNALYGAPSAIGNMYRQLLQTNDSATGKIIAGRVTDANGNPVAGVKVSISKQGETAVWQSMLVWNETVDGSDPYAVRSAMSADEVDGVFRNYTDANGIWFVDKVAAGDYTVNLEKDGFVFQGDTNVTVANQNLWGIGFVAVPEAVGALALESWWLDGGILYLQFNRAIGDVQIDPSCLSVGGTSLSNCAVNSAADSTIVQINVSNLSLSGNLTMTAGFLYIDTDGTSDEAGTYNLPVVKVAPAVKDEAAGSAAESCSVTAITRNGADFTITANELEFKVEGSSLSDITLSDFKLHVTDSYDGDAGLFSRVKGSTLPKAAIGAWDATSGILTVTVGKGYGFVRVDYVPADGSTPFVAGETYRVNKQAPAIISAKLSTDNQYVDITFNKPVGGATELTSQAGIQASADGANYFYTGTLDATSEFALWRKGVVAVADNVYSAAIDGNSVIGSGELAEGQASLGTFPSELRLTATGVPPFGSSITETYAKVLWADIDGDGVFTVGTDGIFVKICDEVKNGAYTDWAMNGPTWSDDNLFSLGEGTFADQNFWLSSSTVPSAESFSSCDAYPLSTLPASLSYYSAEGAFPSPISVPYTSASTAFTTLRSYLSGLMAGPGNGVWLDYSEDTAATFVAGQDTIILGSTPEDATAGTAVPDELRYLDVDGSGFMSTGDFVWMDDGDGAWTREATAGDTLVGKVQPESLNWREPVAHEDFYITLHKNGGTVTDAHVDKVTDLAGNALTGSVTTIRAWLAYEPQTVIHSTDHLPMLESDVNTMNVPAGVETIEVHPYANSIYDADGNAAPKEATTGELVLYSSGNPFIVDASLAFDNYSVAVRFSERVFGSTSGFNVNQVKEFADGGADADTWANASADVRETTRNFSASCVTATVIYDDNSTETLQLTQSGENRAIRYKTGTAFLAIDFITPLDLENNLPLLDPIYQKLNNDRVPASVRIDFSNIGDMDGFPLATPSISFTVHPQYSGSTVASSLPPPMFTNATDAYRFFTAGEQAVRYPGYYKGSTPSSIDDYVFTTTSYANNLDTAQKVYFDYDKGITIQDAIPGEFTYVRTETETHVVLDANGNPTEETETISIPLYTFKPTENGVDLYQYATGDVFESGTSYYKRDMHGYTELTAGTDYEVGDSISTWSEDNTARVYIQKNSEALEYYGIYYRDLDADGRIDAIDLNFHTPWFDAANNFYPTLRAGSQAAANFTVYVKNGNAETDGTWTGFPSWSDYPLSQATDGAIDALVSNANYLAANWDRVSVTGVEVVQQNVNSETYNNPAFSGKYCYSTLRVTIDQTQVAPGTAGPDRVVIAYRCPRAYNGGMQTYNAWHNAGNSATPHVYNEKPLYNVGFSDLVVSEHEPSDEQAGIYWQWDVPETNGFVGCLSPIWVAGSFGPVFAWDGAPAVPVNAFAWRTTPYNKYNESPAEADSIFAYEFVDVYFSEPLGLVEDRGLYNGSTQISGWSGTDFTALNHGPCGADLLNSTTVRFKLNNSANDALNLNFRGAIYPMSGTGIEHAWSANSYSPEFAEFAMNATGILPLCSAYQVTGGSDDKIPVFQITNPTATITTKVVQATSPDEVSHNVTDGTTFTYISKPRSVENINNTTEIDAFFLLSNGGGFNNAQAAITWESDYSMGYVSPKSGANIPGASYYAQVTKALLNNQTIAGYGFDPESSSAIKSQVVFNAPAPTAWTRWSQDTVRTPSSGVLSGPIYNFMNASATVVDNTSRINDGVDMAILGIDAAGASGQTLTAVKVRFVSTNYGQFDPAVDLLPLSDGAGSGVYLYDENAGAVVKISTDGLEWSDWGVNAYGQPYRETTLRALSGASLPATGGDANSFDFTVHIVPSSEFNLGDSFYAEIPADGLVMGNQSSRDTYAETWTTTDGTQGYPLTAYQYKDLNGDYRWNFGEPIADAEDLPPFVAPFYDGGRPYSLRATMSSKHVLWQNGLETRNLYYAKKNGATYSTTDRYKGYYDVASLVGVTMHTAVAEMTTHVNYEPGDDVWFDIGGRPGVYDAGVDIPLFGNADKFILPWAVKQAGARSAWLHGAPHSEAHSVTSGVISAPSGEPIAIVGLNMEDTGRGFGPRYILDGAVLVESVSKNLAAGEYELAYTADGSLAFAGGAAVAIPAEVGARAILTDADGTGFVVIRRMADLFDADEDETSDEVVELPTADETIAFGVSEDLDRDISQPQAITGVRVIAVGNGNIVGTANLTRTGTKLAWNGGAAVDVADGGIFVLKGTGINDYLTVQVTMVGGATSEELSVYQADGQPITPFQNITGLEVMAVGDMIPQGFYNFSYDGMGSLSFGNGGACAVPAAEGDFAFVYGDGVAADYSRPFVVVRRTAAALPATAVTDALYVNQTQLFQVNVTLASVNSVTPNHFLPMSNDEESGISLWWDADASGVFSTGDMFVPLLETPVLEGTGNSWSCSLTPDPAYLTAWLSRAKDVTADNRNNFFVCVKTSVDMSYGDKFTVAANFYDPTEPNYDYSYYSDKTNAFGTAVCFASVTSDVVTCTSVTNTILAKLTATGQTVDADTNVGMVSVEHFVEQAASDNLPYVTQLNFDLYNVQNFDPATMLKSVEKATAAAERGVVLYKDADGDGKLDPEVDTAIETTILVDDSDADVWHYTLMVDGSDCTVSTTDDGLADLFVAVNTAENLPFNVTFYGKMESTAITYNTGKGSASAAVRTDNLTTTVNSDYQQTAGIVNDTTTPGLLVTAAGSGVSGLQKVAVTRDSKGNLVVAWGTNSATVKPGDGRSTLTLGSGDSSLTLVFDPEKFLAAMGEEWDGSEVAWNVMVNSAVTIRRITPENLNTYFQTERAAMSAIVGLDFANSGATDIALTSVTARFTNVSGFATTDLCALAADETSGVQLWKDADGNGVFDPAKDAAMALSGTPSWTNDGTDYIVKLSVSANNKIESAECDGIYDYFLVVVPSTNANNGVETEAGDQFTVTIHPADVVLNKTVNKSAEVVTGTITIDSLPPKLADEEPVTAELNADGTATETVTIAFNEATFGLGLADDLSVWNVTDITEGSAYTVTACEFAEDGLSVKLTLATDESLTYSNDGVHVVADFNANVAIVDIVGNPVEIDADSNTPDEPEPPGPGDDDDPPGPHPGDDDDDDDTDTDADGIADAWETKYFGDLETADATSDYNGDGITDLDEFKMDYDPTAEKSAKRSFYTFVGGEYVRIQQSGSKAYDFSEPPAEITASLDDPTVLDLPDTEVDFDGDSLLNGEEVTDYGTDPTKADTDDDGYDDWEELVLGTDPTNPADPWYNRALDLVLQAHDVTDYVFNEETHALDETTVSVAARTAPHAVVKDFNEQLASTQSYTIELWFKLADDSANSGTLVQKTAPAGRTPDFRLFLDNGELKFALNSNLNKGKTETIFAYPDATFAAGDGWTHVAVAVNQDSNSNPFAFHVNMYVMRDGEALATYESGAQKARINPTSADGDLVIGDLPEATSRLSVAIDELRIWNSERTAAEISSNRDVFLSEATSNMAVYFNFNYGTAERTNALTYKALSDKSEAASSAYEAYQSAYSAWQGAYTTYRGYTNPTEEQTNTYNAAVSLRDSTYSVYTTAYAALMAEASGEGLYAEMRDEARLSIEQPEDATDYLVGDSDNDGMQDWWEYTHFGDLASADVTTDADEDGLSDYYEYLLLADGADPNDPYSLTGDGKTLDGDVDSDGDGLSNSEEMDYSTDPTKVDTDDDGVSDKVEIALGASPTHPMSVVTTIADSKPVTQSWDEIKSTDMTLYRADKAPSRSLDLGALDGDLNLPDADRFAVGTRVVDPYAAYKTSSGDFTLEMWVKPTAGTENGTIFETRAADTGWGWRFLLEDGAPKGEIFNPYGEVIAYVGGQGSTPALPANAWTYVSLVWNTAAKTFNLYRDKVAIIGSLPVNYEIDFGAESEYATIFKMDGVAIDEFRFWGEARSDEQIEYWAETIIPSPLDSLISFINLQDSNGDYYHERFMRYDYKLFANYRFDDGGETVEDFAHFQDADYQLTVADGAIFDEAAGAKVIGGVDDIDGDGVPEWWMNRWEQNQWPNALRNYTHVPWLVLPGMGLRGNFTTYYGSRRNGVYYYSFLDALEWSNDGNTILGLNGYQYGVGYTSLGGTQNYTINEEGSGFSHYSNIDAEVGHAEGTYVTDNMGMSRDMKYVTMHKYVQLSNQPAEAYIEVDAVLGATISGVIVNGQLLDSYGADTNIAQYLQLGRNQIVVVWERNVQYTSEHKIKSPGGSDVTYNRNWYGGAVDVGMTVDNKIVIAKGHDYTYDPRSVWYWRATTADYTLPRMNPSFGNRSTDNNGYTLNKNITDTSLDAYAANYASMVDTDNDGLDLYSEFLLNTNPVSRDSDNNGIFDGNEDYDGDGLVNTIEINELGTDALSFDTDNDGVGDAAERADETEPTDWNDPERKLHLVTDGSEDGYLELPLQSRFALDTFTIEAMVRTAEPTAGGIILQRVVGTVDPENPLVNYELGLTTEGRPYMAFTDKDGNRTGNELIGSTVLEADTWTHLAICFDNTKNTMSLYINGSLDDTALANTPPVSHGPAEVYTRAGVKFNGFIDELRFWNTARTATELQANMNATLAGDEDGLVAYYRFDDAYLPGRGELADEAGSETATAVADAKTAVADAQQALDDAIAAMDDEAIAAAEEALAAAKADYDAAVAAQDAKLRTDLTIAAKYLLCADSYIGSARDWSAGWVNAARLNGTATVKAPGEDVKPDEGDDDDDDEEFEDSDGDGIADEWEQKYFGDLTTADATTDNDEDGVNDLIEFQMDYDPTEAVSNPRSYYTFVNGEYVRVTQNGKKVYLYDTTTNVTDNLDDKDILNASDADVDYDGDYLINGDEVAVGTNPLRMDSDNDGYTDLEEIEALGTDATDADDPKVNRGLDLVLAEHEITEYVVDDEAGELAETTETVAARTAPYALVKDFADQIKSMQLYTMELKFKLAEDSGTSGTLVQKCNKDGKVGDFWLGLVDGVLTYKYRATGGKEATVAYPASYGTFEAGEGWVHVAIVMAQDSTGSKNLYHTTIYVNKDGEDLKTYKAKNKSGVLYAKQMEGDLVFGDLEAAESRLSAVIDEFRIWNVERTDTEVAAYRDVELSKDTENLAVYFDFNGSSVDDGRVVAKVSAELAQAASAVATAQAAVATAQAAYDTAASGSDNTATTNAQTALNAAKAQLAAAQLAYDALQKGGSNVYASLKGDARLAVVTDAAVSPETGTLSVGIYAYSTGTDEADVDPGKAYVGDDTADTLQAAILSFATAETGEDLTYKYFWLLTDAKGYKVDNLSYAAGELDGVDAEDILGRYSELALAGTEVTAGDYIQLVVVAVDAEDAQVDLAVSKVIAIEQASGDELLADLVLVSPTSDQTGLSKGAKLTVEVQNANEVDGTVHISWFKNLTLVKSATAELAAGATASLTMDDASLVEEGDVWSFKVWFEDENGRRTAAIPPTTEKPGMEWVFLMIGQPYEQDEDDTPSARDFAAPSKPTAKVLPEVIYAEGSTQGCWPYCVATGSSGRYSFDYEYQWYYKAYNSENFVKADGQTFSTWLTIKEYSTASNDTGTSIGGFTTYVLDEGDQIYCVVKAVNVYGNASAATASNVVTIKADNASSYYEPNDSWKKASFIESKQSWLNSSVNVQTHSFKSRDDHDWVWFVVKERSDNKAQYVTFETNTGVMYGYGYTKTNYSAPNTALTLYRYNEASNSIKAIKSVRDFSSNDDSGTETVFARFERLKLEPGIYYIDVYDEFMNNNDVGLDYYMHLYVEADMATAETATWDTSDLDYHYETVTSTDESGAETTSTVRVYEDAVVLEPASPALSDDLNVTINAKCYDSEGKEIKTFYYYWFRNGQLVNFAGSTAIKGQEDALMQFVDWKQNLKKGVRGMDTVSADLTFEGDVWQCMVVPYSEVDGYATDAAITTNTVTIGSANSWSLTLSRGSFVDDVWTATDRVVLGWKDNATNGFDLAFDEASPSLTVPNGDGTYTRQVLENGAIYSLGLSNQAPYLQKDYRPYGKSATWFVVVEMGTNSTGCTLALSKTGDIPEDATGVTINQMYKRTDGYYDVVPGNKVIVDSGDSGYISLSDADYAALQTDANGQKYAVFRVSIGGSDDSMQEMKLTAGWNLVSFSLTPTANDVDDVFSKDGSKLYSGVVWEFTGGRYVEATTVQAGKAYWLYSKAAATVTVYGSAAADSISLEEGWNLIGPVYPVDDFVAAYKKSYPDVFAKIATNEDGGLEIYKFVYDKATGNSSYGLATDGSAYKLELGQGYWIKATQAVDLPFIEAE